MLQDSILKINQDTTQGRYFVANEEVKASAILHRAKAFVSIVDQQSIQRVCYHCIKEPQSLKDPLIIECKNHCQKVYYCSKSCAELDWNKYHQFECGFQEMESFPDYTIDYMNLIKRLLIRWSQESNKDLLESVASLCDNMSAFDQAKHREFTLVTKELERFVSLKLHQFKIPQISSDLMQQVQKFANCDKETEITDVFAFIYRLICQEECNSFGLYTFNYLGPQNPRQGYGLALYPTAVFFNHSCSPNVGHCQTPEGDLTFFAIKDLAKNETAYISYLNVEECRQNRQSILWSLFHFICQCDRCQLESAHHDSKYVSGKLLCAEKGCFGHLAPTANQKWTCNGCHRILD
ncbi:hypothetical protein BC833DRAFT_618199 [Globomyces pollinis-pini]|nr:hypothetical protein BC833DRAFT_618199 [Globomyces pollinis-pini]